MSRILVVDDMPAIRAILRLILTQAGHEVEEAVNGVKAVAAIRQRPADLVICDLYMPEKEGLQTIRELKAIRPSLRIIAISGGTPLSAMDFLPLARRLGASRTLSKPFTVEQVLEAVGAVLAEGRPGSEEWAMPHGVAQAASPRAASA